MAQPKKNSVGAGPLVTLDQKITKINTNVVRNHLLYAEIDIIHYYIDDELSNIAYC